MFTKVLPVTVTWSSSIYILIPSQVILNFYEIWYDLKGVVRNIISPLDVVVLCCMYTTTNRVPASPQPPLSCSYSVGSWGV